MTQHSKPPAKKAPARKWRLFPRSLEEAVRDATKPLMDKQGKLYSALLRDWKTIVGAERASISLPDRLHFPTQEAQGATLHLKVRPAAAPELNYAIEQILEQCARYFGYRAIARIVLHPSHDIVPPAQTEHVPAAPSSPAASLPPGVPEEMRGVFERLAQHIASASDKKDETR